MGGGEGGYRGFVPVHRFESTGIEQASWLLSAVLAQSSGLLYTVVANLAVGSELISELPPMNTCSIPCWRAPDSGIGGVCGDTRDLCCWSC